MRKTEIMLQIKSACLTTFSRFVQLSLVCMLFVGCASREVSRDPRDIGPAPETSITMANIEAKISAAESLPRDERLRVYLQAAEVYIYNESIDEAKNLLYQLDTSKMSQSQRAEFNFVNAKLSFAEGSPEKALQQIDLATSPTATPTLDLNQRLRFLEFKSTLLFNLGKTKESIENRVLISKLLQPGDIEGELNQDLIWQSLVNLSQNELKRGMNYSDYQLRGWYSLALTTRDHRGDLGQQLKAVEQWQREWDAHSASQRLPADLLLLKQLVHNQPAQLAILLPFSGKLANAANAIRDGINAAFYTAAKSSNRVPVVRFYDSNSGDVSEIHKQAVKEGAEAVIGPLKKENIAALAKQSRTSVPTLALNEISADGKATANLFQFGLVVEDEAMQVAERAWLDGKRRSMILAPSGSWGDRSIEAFTKSWQDFGGVISKNARFAKQNDYSPIIEQALGLKESDQRHRQIQNMLGIRVEFEPRPRKDIDMIFLVAKPDEARQIKPTLAFHYAGDIPVYATSHLYNGMVDKNADRDMNDIRFTTLPWFFDNSSAEKLAITKHVKRSSLYERLYAFGVDAYQLHPRLLQLRKVQRSSFAGSTGVLSMNENQQIKREQIWARFENGLAQLMPSTLSKATAIE